MLAWNDVALDEQPLLAVCVGRTRINTLRTDLDLNTSAMGDQHGLAFSS